MAINLITGHKGTVDHITAKNGRWMNRATFGNGNYMLVGGNGKSGDWDSDYAYVGAGNVTGGKQLTLYEGIILWNGMFIYVTGNTTYSEPVESCTGWKVYLHYVNSSNVESVEVVFTNDDSSFSSKIKTNAQFTDSTSEAYVLYATYENASGSTVTYAFEKKKASMALIDSLTTALAGKVDTSTYEAEKSFSLTEIQEMFCSHSTGDDRVDLGGANVATNTSPTATGAVYTDIQLSEDIRNFAFCEVRIGTTQNNSDYKFIVPSVYLCNGVSASNSSYGGSSSNRRICWKTSNNSTIYKNYTYMYSFKSSNVWWMRVGHINLFDNGDIFNGNNGSRNTYFRIYGVGRVANA